MSWKLRLLLGLVVLAGVARLCVFTVDRTEFVYLTQFGEHVATYDGADANQAGLHFRLPWPIQSVTRIDRRLQVLDLQPSEHVTQDPREGGTIDKTLAIDAYVVWRVPDTAAVERFIVSVGSVERAREILRDRIRGRLGAAVARMQMADLISDQPGQVDEQRDRLRLKLLSPGTTAVAALAASGGQPWNGLTLTAAAGQELPPEAEDGLELVDVRIRRLNYPDQVRRAIFDRIVSERNRKVAYHQSRGRAEAEGIKSAAEAQISIDLAETKRNNDVLRGQADARADRILRDAISLDPAYYAELKQREIGLASVGSARRVFSSQLFRLFFPPVGRTDPPAGVGARKEGPGR